MKIADRAPTCEFNPGICLTTEEKARKNLSQGSQRMLLPITKTPIQLQYPPYTDPQYYNKPHYLPTVQINYLTLKLLTPTIVAPPSNASKWQMGFKSAFKGLNDFL